MKESTTQELISGANKKHVFPEPHWTMKDYANCIRTGLVGQYKLKLYKEQLEPLADILESSHGRLEVQEQEIKELKEESEFRRAKMIEWRDMSDERDEKIEELEVTSKRWADELESRDGFLIKRNIELVDELTQANDKIASYFKLVETLQEKHNDHKKEIKELTQDRDDWCAKYTKEAESFVECCLKLATANNRNKELNIQVHDEKEYTDNLHDLLDDVAHRCGVNREFRCYENEKETLIGEMCDYIDNLKSQLTTYKTTLAAVEELRDRIRTNLEVAIKRGEGYEALVCDITDLLTQFPTKDQS